MGREELGEYVKEPPIGDSSPTLDKFLQSKVSAFISDETRVDDPYTVDKDASGLVVVDAIVSEKNAEKAVVVVDPAGSRHVIGVISNIDALKWIRDAESAEAGLVKLRKSNAQEIMNSTCPPTGFFFVGVDDTLERAMDQMREHEVDHIVVLNDKMEYQGWVNKKVVLTKLIQAL